MQRPINTLIISMTVSCANCEYLSAQQIFYRQLCGTSLSLFVCFFSIHVNKLNKRALFICSDNNFAATSLSLIVSGIGLISSKRIREIMMNESDTLFENKLKFCVKRRWECIITVYKLFFVFWDRRKPCWALIDDIRWRLDHVGLVSIELNAFFHLKDRCIRCTKGYMHRNGCNEYGSLAKSRTD